MDFDADEGHRSAVEMNWICQKNFFPTVLTSKRIRDVAQELRVRSPQIPHTNVGTDS